MSSSIIPGNLNNSKNNSKHYVYLCDVCRKQPQLICRCTSMRTFSLGEYTGNDLYVFDSFAPPQDFSLSLYVIKHAIIAYIDDNTIMNSIIKTKYTKLFEHDYPTEYKFCPKTGESLWDMSIDIPNYIKHVTGVKTNISDYVIMDSKNEEVASILKLSPYNYLGFYIIDLDIAINEIYKKMEMLYNTLVEYDVLNCTLDEFYSKIKIDKIDIHQFNF